MVWKPDVTVAAVVERDGHFLVVEERIRGRRVFNQPAGHLDAGETLLQAVVRETLEETAWHFQPQWLIGTYLCRHSPELTTLRFAFGGELLAHEPQRALDVPVIAAHWLTRAQLAAPERQLRSPLVLRCIDDHLGGRRYGLELLG